MRMATLNNRIAVIPQIPAGNIARVYADPNAPAAKQAAFEMTAVDDDA